MAVVAAAASDSGAGPLRGGLRASVADIAATGATRLARMPAPAPPARRTALFPAIVGVLALLIGLALLNSDAFTVIRYIVSIFALIVAVFAWRARHWWWLIGLVPIAVLWNPVLPIEIGEELWFGMQYIAAIVLLAAGAFIREPGEAATTTSARR